MSYVDHLRSYLRSLNYYFEQREIDRNDRGSFVGRRWENDRERSEAWLRDTLMWGIEQYIAGSLKFAYRGVILSAEEAANCGHDSITNDAFITLKNACEEALEMLERDRDVALMMLSDRYQDQGQGPAESWKALQEAKKR